MPPQPKKSRIEAPAESETTIDKLNDDVLVEVFSFLDSANLKTAALVCKQWNDVIGMSAVTMNKFRLELNRGFFATNGSSNRKHQEIELDVEDLELALSNLRRFNVSQAKDARILGVAQVDYQQLARFLSLMPLLERLEFHFSDENHINDSPVQRVNLPKLRDIFNTTEEYRIYDFINAENLTDLTCISLTRNETVIVSHADKLISFLTRCKKLTSLAIGECIFIELFHLNEMPAMEFKLESLTLHSFSGASYDQNISFDRFEQFLISQAPTLTKMSISPEILKFTSDVFKTIFSRLTLKDFSVRGHALPVDQQFYDNMRPLESLRKLTINPGRLRYKLIAVKKFLRKCPNIETLDLDRIDCDLLKHVARYNLKVTRLSIDNIRKVFPDDLQFRSLKMIEVRDIEQNHFSHFLSVIKNCPEIETIDMDCDEITADVVGELMKQPKLKELKFSPENDDLDKIFSLIKQKRAGAEMLIDGRSEKTSIKFPSQLN